MNKIHFKKVEFIILIFIFLFHLINNLIILKKDTTPLFYDEGGFYNMSVYYFRDFMHSKDFYEIFKRFYKISRYYPPFTMLCNIPFYILFGESPDVSCAVNSFFLFILLLSVYGIGKYIKDAKTGLFSVFIISTFPAVFGFSRTNFITIPLTAMTALSIYLLLKADYFKNSLYSFLFGISIGLSLLTKWSWTIYLIGPFLVYIYFGFYLHREDIRFKIGNLMLALIVGFLIASTWYLPNISQLMGSLVSLGYRRKVVTSNIFNLHLFRYISILEEHQMFTFYSIIFLVCLFHYVLSKNRLKSFILTGILAPYIFFSFTPEINSRYTVSVLPFAALIVGNEINKIRNVIFRKSLIVIIIFIGLVQFFLLSHRNDSSTKYSAKDFIHRTSSGLLSAKTVDWKINEIFEIFKRIDKNRPPKVVILPYTYMTSALTYKMELMRDKNPIIFIVPLVPVVGADGYKYISTEKYPDIIKDTDYILTEDKGNLVGADERFLIEKVNLLKIALEQNLDRFDLVARFEVDDNGDGSNVLIYKRKEIISGTK